VQGQGQGKPSVAPQRSLPGTAPRMRATRTALEHEARLAARLAAAEDAAQELRTNPALKPQRRALEKQITMAVSQISGTQQQVRHNSTAQHSCLSVCPTPLRMPGRTPLGQECLPSCLPVCLSIVVTVATAAGVGAPTVHLLLIPPGRCKPKHSSLLRCCEARDRLARLLSRSSRLRRALSVSVKARCPRSARLPFRWRMCVSPSAQQSQHLWTCCWPSFIRWGPQILRLLLVLQLVLCYI
jgi:GLE1-like protein